MNAKVEELFHRLADLPPAVRTQYFLDHPVDDDTRREVEALLAFEPEASHSLEHEISVAARRALPQIEGHGWRCGPYRLIGVIGRGGMGAVYLAERVDGEVQQRVAVKLLPPGADDVRAARFLQERQILANLAHPNIARLMDAGHTGRGMPFLVMEYVEGDPIDVFVSGLTLRETIGVFLGVCDAVGYLHRHLIVHRDLKPSNILVTADGTPKLLDFGIAKLLELSADATVTSLRMLTPAYASPEHISGTSLSTASDIYSLGALLYRLLTGKPTHDVDERSADAVAAAIATRGAVPPSRWRPELKGDLESILLKALRHDPQDRYATVEQLADDLRAYLDSRPVRARAGNAWYTGRKFVRRHWIPLSAAGIVIVSLSVGLLVASRERAIAQRRFADVRQLANKLFDIDRQVRQLPGSTKARQMIVDTSLEYLRRLRVEAQSDPDLALEVANAYKSVAQVEGLTTGPNLGQVDEAERDIGIADDLIQSVLRRRPTNRPALLQAADIASARMTLAWQSARNGDALAFANRAAGFLERYRAGSADVAQASGILTLYVNVAHQYMISERFDECVRLANRGSELALAFGRPLERGDFLTNVALAHRYRGDLDRAADAARESVRLLEPDPDETRVGHLMNFVLALAREGWILGEDGGISLGHSDEAVAVLERAFKIADEFVHKDRFDESTRSRLYLAGGPMGDILRHANPARALAVYDHTLKDMDDVHGKFLQLRLVNVLAGSSYALRRLDRPTEARQRIDRAFAILGELKLYPADRIELGSEAYRAIAARAEDDADAGDPAAAMTRYEDLLRRVTAFPARPDTSLPDATELSNLYRSMAGVARRAGQIDRANALETACAELWRRWNQKLPNNQFVLRQIALKPSA